MHPASIAVLCLALCLVAAAPARAATERAGVSGRITVSPACPGPQKAGEEPCTRPLAGARVGLLALDGSRLRTAVSAADGGFRFDAAAGRYRIHVDVDALYPRCPDVEVTVPRAARATVTVECDSGMR